MKTEWKNLVGKRLLITGKITKIPRNEWTMLEISPSGMVAKFRNETANCQFWTDLDELMVMEVLPPNDQVEARRGVPPNPSDG